MQDPDIPAAGQSSPPRGPLADGAAAAEMPPDYPRRLAEAIIGRADTDAALLLDFLASLGHGLGSPQADYRQPPPEPVARGLVKLAAALRLDRWENAGLTPLLRQPLPAAGEVFEDLCRHPAGGEAQAHPAERTAARVLAAYLFEMAWRPLGDPTAAADVVVSSVDGSDLLDPVAELLWQFRHLPGDEGNSNLLAGLPNGKPARGPDPEQGVGGS